MKTFSAIILATTLLFSGSAFAAEHTQRHEQRQACTRAMLEQVANITTGYRPVIGNSLYVVEKKNATIIVVRFYDSNKVDAEPMNTDMQAIFVKTKVGCKLSTLVFSPVDVTDYINILVE